jgi:hypothetical protein
MASSSGHLIGEWRPRIDEEWVENDVLDSLRRLLSEGFVVAYEESLVKPELLPCARPGLDAADLEVYWFEPTESGRARWESWQRTVGQ